MVPVVRTRESGRCSCCFQKEGRKNKKRALRVTETEPEGKRLTGAELDTALPLARPGVACTTRATPVFPPLTPLPALINAQTCMLPANIGAADVFLALAARGAGGNCAVTGPTRIRPPGTTVIETVVGTVAGTVLSTDTGAAATATVAAFTTISTITATTLLSSGGRTACNTRTTTAAEATNFSVVAVVVVAEAGDDVAQAFEEGVSAVKNASAEGQGVALGGTKGAAKTREESAPSAVLLRAVQGNLLERERKRKRKAGEDGGRGPRRGGGGQELRYARRVFGATARGRGKAEKGVLVCGIVTVPLPLHYLATTPQETHIIRGCVFFVNRGCLVSIRCTVRFRPQ